MLRVTSIVMALILALSLTASAGGSATPGGKPPEPPKEKSATGTGTLETATGTGTTPASGTGTAPADPKEKPAQPGAKGQAQRTAAHAKVASRLQAMLDAGKIKNENARANLAATIERLAKGAVEAGEAKTEREALEQAEQGLTEAGAEATAGELDVLAEVQKRLGMKDKAKETLRERLQKNDKTKEAYDELLKLEAESGEKKDFDTFVNGKKLAFDVRPRANPVTGRVLVPIRFLTEALGAVVGWDQETQSVTITKGDTVIKLKLGSNIATVNGQQITLDEPASAEGGRTLVPVRFVSQALGMAVEWLGEHKAITVTKEKLESTPDQSAPTTGGN